MQGPLAEKPGELEGANSAAPEGAGEEGFEGGAETIVTEGGGVGCVGGRGALGARARVKNENIDVVVFCVVEVVVPDGVVDVRFTVVDIEEEDEATMFVLELLPPPPKRELHEPSSDEKPRAGTGAATALEGAAKEGEGENAAEGAAAGEGAAEP